jgi:hypothetical protein
LVLDLFEDARRQGVWAGRDPGLAALLLLRGLRRVIRFGDRPRPFDLAGRIVGSFLRGVARPD